MDAWADLVATTVAIAGEMAPLFGAALCMVIAWLIAQEGLGLHVRRSNRRAHARAAAEDQP